jgi:leucyl-tRNA synthetase
MEFTNGFAGGMDGRTEPAARAFAIKRLIVMLAPFAPHRAEEWWTQVGETPSIFDAGWPSFDEAAAKEETIEVPVQINGKHRATLTVPRGLDKEAMLQVAMQDPKVSGALAGKPVRRSIVIQDKLVNLVV